MNPLIVFNLSNSETHVLGDLLQTPIQLWWIYTQFTSVRMSPVIFVREWLFVADIIAANKPVSTQN